MLIDSLRSLSSPLFAVCLSAGLLAAALPAQAALINHADVNGIRTFQDTSTGRVWADLDNWISEIPGGPVINLYPNDLTAYRNALTSAGFVWATSAEVQQLINFIPVASQLDRDALEAVATTAFPGIMEPLGGFADAGAGAVQRFYVSPTTGSWSTNNFYVGLPMTTDGVWAYLPSASGPGSSSVPEPASMALAGLALFTAAGLRRRRP